MYKENIKQLFQDMLDNNSYMNAGVKYFELLDKAKTYSSIEFQNVYIGIGYVFTPKIVYIRAIFDINGNLLGDEMGKDYDGETNQILDIFQGRNYYESKTNKI